MQYISIENQLKIGYINKKSFKEFVGSFDILSKLVPKFPQNLGLWYQRENFSILNFTTSHQMPEIVIYKIYWWNTRFILDIWIYWFFSSNWYIFEIDASIPAKLQFSPMMLKEKMFLTLLHNKSLNIRSFWH